MTEIKICGITSPGDALAAAEAGADAVGFIFHRPSPRFITPERVREIVRSLPPEVAAVGVFVDRDPGEVEAVRSFCGLDFVQLHGREPLSAVRRFPPERVIKAVNGPPAEARETLRSLTGLVRAVLVDASTKELPGGTGLRSDWDLARDAGRQVPVLLAGGLSCENIEEALSAVSPAGVDVNSGIEISPGVKDRRLLRRIVELVKRKGGGGREKIFVPAAQRRES